MCFTVHYVLCVQHWTEGKGRQRRRHTNPCSHIWITIENCIFVHRDYAYVFHKCPVCPLRGGEEKPFSPLFVNVLNLISHINLFKVISAC